MDRSKGRATRLIALARELGRAGNGENAQQILNDCSEKWGEDLMLCESVAALWAQPVLDGSILAPIINENDVQRNFLVRIEIEPNGIFSQDAINPAFADNARDSIRSALDDAWRLVRGPGQRPAVTVRIPVLDLIDLSVKGTSLYLATAFAAVSRFGDAAPQRTVVATGCFEEVLTYTNEKRDITIASADHTGCHKLLAAGMGRPESDKEVTHLTSLEDAVDKVFPYRPWHAQADCVRLHVFCGANRAAQQRRFDGHDVISINLPEQLTKEQLPRVAEETSKYFRHGARVELSVGGPVFLAAFLGAKMSAAGTIRFIHENKVWWDNTRKKQKHLFDEHAPNPLKPLPADQNRVVIVRGNRSSLPDGWKSIPAYTDLEPRDLEPRDIAPLLRRMESLCRQINKLHLGMDVPLPLAWALGNYFSNRLAVDYYRWIMESRSYEYVFSG